MGELLKHIRTIKMYTWEQIFTSRILQIRNRELKQLSVCKLFLEAFRVAQNVIHLLREHLGPYHCCLEYKRPNFLSLIMNCVMRSDQKVHGCILCLLLGSIDSDLHHLHIWSLCGHRTYFRRRNGTLEKNLLTIKNQVDLYFYKPKIDVYISFELLDIGVIAFLATHSLYRVLKNQRVSHTRVVCANGAGVHQPGSIWYSCGAPQQLSMGYQWHYWGIICLAKFVLVSKFWTWWHIRSILVSISSKVSGSNLVTFLNCTPIFECCVVRCGSKNRYLKDVFWVRLDNVCNLKNLIF